MQCSRSATNLALGQLGLPGYRSPQPSKLKSWFLESRLFHISARNSPADFSFTRFVKYDTTILSHQLALDSIAVYLVPNPEWGDGNAIYLALSLNNNINTVCFNKIST